MPDDGGMDMKHTEDEVRKWSASEDARGLHEYMKEEHDIEQDPHLAPGVGAPTPRRAQKLIPISIGVLTLLALLGVFVASTMFSPVANDGVGVRFTIEPGTPLTQIVQNLEDEGLIENYWSVALLLRMQGKENVVKAGTFTLSPTMSPQRIVEILTATAPPKDDIEVTIPEGFTAVDIVKRLVLEGVYEDGEQLLNEQVDLEAYPFVDAGSCSAGDGVPCSTTFGALEGYLFPDTYRFDTDASVQDIADRFLKNFSAKFDEALRAEVAASGRTLRDVVIVASLIEEEAVNDPERPLIAGVIAQRLERGMLLQIDASVLYAQELVVRAIPGARFKAVDREITFSDLKIDSPYNTYKYGGLPPGPIASPGLASLIAALRPETSDYLFYLHDAEGNIHFARTLEEHISNRNRFLK